MQRESRVLITHEDSRGVKSELIIIIIGVYGDLRREAARGI